MVVEPVDQLELCAQLLLISQNLLGRLPVESIELPLLDGQVLVLRLLLINVHFDHAVVLEIHFLCPLGDVLPLLLQELFVELVVVEV